jgi:hypothetical protein
VRKVWGILEVVECLKLREEWRVVVEVLSSASGVVKSD